jgi:uncharacterized protein (DUF433 family)
MNVHTLPAWGARPTPCPGGRDLFSLREIITLAEIPEKRVRKDIEVGVLTSPRVWRLHDARLCFHWLSVVTLAAVYSNEFLNGRMRRIALDRVHARTMHWDDHFEARFNAFRECLDVFECPPCDREFVEVDKFVTINLAAVCEKVMPRLSAYRRGLCGVEERDDVLGGEAVFKNSRLSVVHIGKMADDGESVVNMLEDYPYLGEADVEFARLYWRSHPPVGRPKTEETSTDGKARTG